MAITNHRHQNQLFDQITCFFSMSVYHHVIMFFEHKSHILDCCISSQFSPINSRVRCNCFTGHSETQKLPQPTQQSSLLDTGHWFPQNWWSTSFHCDGRGTTERTPVTVGTWSFPPHSAASLGAAAASTGTFKYNILKQLERVYNFAATTCVLWSNSTKLVTSIFCLWILVQWECGTA